jgi:hypothetical protein
MSKIATSPGDSEDIDLLLLVERSIAFFRKYRWIFLGAVILGLAAGYFIYSRLPKVYKSRMILHSYTLSNQDYIQVIDNWNTLLKKGEYDLLSASFNLSPAILACVKEMKGNEIQKVFTANNPNGFYIDVTVTDNSILDSLQSGILKGVENVDYIKKQLQIKKDNLALLISEVQREITRLDSTKAKIESMLDNGGHASNLFIDISGLNKQLIELNEKWLYYQQDLKLTNAVQVLQGFSKFDKPAGPSLIVWLGLGLIFFLAIAYVYALYHSVSQKLRTRRANTRMP